MNYTQNEKIEQVLFIWEICGLLLGAMVCDEGIKSVEKIPVPDVGTGKDTYSIVVL